MLANEKDFIELSRDEFCEVMKRLDPDNLIINKLENEHLAETPSYIFTHYEDDVSIIEKYNLDCTPRIINWYKLYHVGRCLNLYGFTSRFQLFRFIHECVGELRKEK